MPLSGHSPTAAQTIQLGQTQATLARAGVTKRLFFYHGRDDITPYSHDEATRTTTMKQPGIRVSI
jgi:hypothetical protein